jgi:CheY-like chemotaxis protein
MEGNSSPPKVTIVLADDHAVVRSGLRMLLEAEEDMEVVAEAGDAEAARRYTLGHKPSVLVLDLNMPGESGLDAIPKVLESTPETVVVVLTMQNDPAFAREALRAGAHDSRRDVDDALPRSRISHLTPHAPCQNAWAAPREGAVPITAASLDRA